MLTEAIAYSVPIAFGIALSPLPIAATVTILLSARPRNASAFFLGWILGIISVGAIVFLIPGLDTARGEPTPLAGWIRIFLGVFLLLLAIRLWHNKPDAGSSVELPKMLSNLDANTIGKSVVIGFFLSALNPKNLILTFTGAATIYSSMITPTQQGIALAVFAFVASLSIGIPIVVYSLFREQVQASLVNLKDWMIRNNSAVMAVLLSVFGLLIFGSGLKVLNT